MEDVSPLTQGEAHQSPTQVPYRALPLTLDDGDLFDGLLSNSYFYDDSRQPQGTTSAQERPTTPRNDDHTRSSEHQNTVDTERNISVETNPTLVTERSPLTAEVHDTDESINATANDRAASQDRDQHSQSAVEDIVKPPAAYILRQHWNPIWLRRYALVGFAALFASLAGALVVLWVTNNEQNGYTTVLGTNHYAWTYGPTAMLVVVLSLWRQVEYHCKMLQPWQELHKGSAEAKHSMLLDYLSPLQAMSLVKAI